MSKSIDQVLTGYFDDITSSKINSNELVSNNVLCTNFLGSPASYYTNPTSNIQTQLNNLQILANEGGSGVFFTIYGEISDLKTSVNNGFFTFYKRFKVKKQIVFRNMVKHIYAI